MGLDPVTRTVFSGGDGGGNLPASAKNAKHKTHFTVASDTIGVNLNCLMFGQEKSEAKTKATAADVLNLGRRWPGFSLELEQDQQDDYEDRL